MERAHQPREKEAEKVKRIRRKQEMLADAASLVEHYQELITMLVSVHREPIEMVNWNEIMAEEPPDQPVFSSQHEQNAANTLANYKPSFFVKLLGMERRRKLGLENKIKVAAKKDQDGFEKANEEYKKHKEECDKTQLVARGVLNMEPEGFMEVIEQFNPFSQIGALGKQLQFDFFPDHINVDLEVYGEDTIPKQILTLTSTGKLSKRDMPPSKRNGLYQEHISSSILRVAREVLALLPLAYVIVNARTELLNMATGRMEVQVILSIAAYPETLAGMDFNRLDPAECLRNFKHNIDFSKTAGFRRVERLNDQGGTL
ncbi:MAG: hypothetical protein Q8927_17315 [Bacteroidota bacterium]|nr:hypothetical protein [Bacteroidota bacterium]